MTKYVYISTFNQTLAVHSPGSLESCTGIGTTVIPRKTAGNTVEMGTTVKKSPREWWGWEKHHDNTAVMGLNQTVIPLLWMCVLPAPIFTHFWRDLASVAREVLGVRATSTSYERSFSLAGRTIEERRTQLLVIPSTGSLCYMDCLNWLSAIQYTN